MLQLKMPKELGLVKIIKCLKISGDYFPTIGDEIEKKMFPLSPGPYYMPYPYADGESGVPPKYTMEEWDQPHVPYVNLLNKEIFKDPDGLYIYSRTYHDSGGTA
ncbi:hypothetical protein Tco_0069941 [Tanacetum coccineum]